MSKKDKEQKNMEKEDINCKQNCDCHCHEHNCKQGGNDEKCSCHKPNCEKEADKIQNLTAQVEEWQNKYLRAYADAENTKRRAEIDAKNLVDYKVSNFARDMLPLFDNLSLAIASIKDSVDENVLTGLRAVMENFETSLKRNGITKIETVGKKLNPSEHRVVSQIESDAKPDSIIQEFQSGWKLGDKVIREAMVATAKPKQ
ncbi:MAG: nucleotide exchange factor GrpE [Alphaproteobacteria bacterium]|nr:nucleotide exchange factor GrpE [Alphaproteobacteria bacterium]